MLSYGKSRLRLDRVLLALGLSYIAVATIAYHAKEVPDLQANTRSSELQKLEDHCQHLEQALKAERGRQLPGAFLCLPDNQGPSVDATGLPLLTVSSSYSVLDPKDPKNSEVLGRRRVNSINITRTKTELVGEDLTLLADGVELAFVFGEDEWVSLGAIMKSWEHALGHTMIVSEVLAQSMVKFECKGDPTLSWGQFKRMMDGQGIAFLEQHVGQRDFVITAFKKEN